MSMILYLKRISDADISRLMATPAGVHAFIEAGQEEPDRGPEYAAALAELKKRMAAAGQAPPPRFAMAFGAYPFNDVFDVDKMWHGLYFLLTGTDHGGASPVNYLFYAPSVGDEDVGYGPARAISAAQTGELSEYLDGLEKSAVLAHFDAQRMKALNIYPDIWDEDAAELKEALGGAFDEMKAYCRKCVAHGLGMLAYIS